MDEIKLADYVKFENDAISRDFTFTLADGNVLPDGLKLLMQEYRVLRKKQEHILLCLM